MCGNMRTVHESSRGKGDRPSGVLGEFPLSCPDWPVGQGYSQNSFPGQNVDSWDTIVVEPLSNQHICHCRGLLVLGGDGVSEF